MKIHFLISNSKGGIKWGNEWALSNALTSSVKMRYQSPIEVLSKNYQILRQQQ
jgi:hypothetical protein